MEGIKFKNTYVNNLIKKEQLEKATRIITNYGIPEDSAKTILYVLGIQCFDVDFIEGKQLTKVGNPPSMPMFRTEDQVQFFNFHYQADSITVDYEQGTIIKQRKGKTSFIYTIRTEDGLFVNCPEQFIALDRGDYYEHKPEAEEIINAYNENNKNIKEVYKFISALNLQKHADIRMSDIEEETEEIGESNIF